MVPASRERILERVGPEAIVLDVGGWAKPFSRADWVIDLMPYETRGMYGEPDPDPERFDASRWIARDICAREPWPFADDHFDFAICSQTLEDVRDPVWVCEEIARVARAGYIEVPSRIEEQAHGVHGDWVGYSHHRWLVDVHEAGIDFVFKSAVLQSDPALWIPGDLAALLTPEERTQALWWEGDFAARERIFVGSDEIDDYLAAGVAGWRDHLAERRPGSKRRRLGR